MVNSRKRPKEQRGCGPKTRGGRWRDNISGGGKVRLCIEKGGGANKFLT